MKSTLVLALMLFALLPAHGAQFSMPDGGTRLK
jgi:hypothetical protein